MGQNIAGEFLVKNNEMNQFHANVLDANHGYYSYRSRQPSG